MVGRRLCIAGATLGAVGLFGWISGATWLTTMVPGQAPMVPNTSLSLALIGGAGVIRWRESVGAGRRALSLAAAGVVLAVGLGTLAEYVLAVDLHIDQLLVVSETGPYPGRPSPPTALALACLGAAVLLFDCRRTARVRPSEWLALATGLIACAAALGQLFGAGATYRLVHARVIGVAVPTAISLFLISLGLLLERPDWGCMRIATSPGPGGVMFRRLVVAAVVGPILLGVVLMTFLDVLGVEEFRLLYASLLVASSVVGLLLLLVNAAPLDRMHAALESTRSRAQELVDQAVDGIFVADLDGRYTDVNVAGCRMLGFDRGDLVGKSIADLLPAEQVERLPGHKERLVAGHTEVGEWSLLRADGTYLPVEMSAKMLPGGRWQGIVRDIRERKRVQEETRRAMERFELALRGADLGAWDWDITTGEVVFNQRWAEMRGLRLDEVRPHVDSWISDVHPDDMARVQKSLSDHFRGLEPEYEAEHRVRTHAGEWIWVLDRGRVFSRDADGRPTRMAGTELDITARKRAEEALRLSELKFSGIVSLAADAIISIDENQRITLFNEGAEKIFGYSQSEVIGAPLDILIPERFRGAHRQLVERFAAGAEAARRMGGRSSAIVGLRKSGEEFPAEASISRLAVGSARHLTVSLRDITERTRQESERKRVEAALQESEARLRLATEAAEIGTWDYDPRSGELVWSEREKALFGLSRHAHVDHDTFLRGLHLDDRERAVENIERAEDPSRGGWYRDEFRIVGIEDGVERWISAQGRCFFDEHNLPRRFIGADVDVTEKRLSAQRAALLAEASRLLVPGSVRASVQSALGAVTRAVSERLGASCWVALLSEDERSLLTTAFTTRSAELGARLGLLGAASVPIRDDWLGRALGERRSLLVPLLDAQTRADLASVEAFKPALAGDALTSLMLAPLVVADRALGVIACFRGGGRAYGRADLIMLQDLADRCALATAESRSFQRAEQARQQIESIIDAVPFLISYVDASGRYAYVSRGYELWFGRSRAEFVGEHVSENVGVEAYEHLRPMVEAALRGERKQFELTLTYARGGTREVAANYLPQFDESGRPAGFVAVIVDVSEHKVLVESLRRSLRFSEEFVGMLGHDLRSPLNAIAMTCEILLRKLGDPWATKSVQRIRSSADRMARMIAQILDFTRARLGGGIPVRPAPVDLATLAADIVAEVRSGTQRSISLEIEGDTQGQWDPDRLGQVLANLIANAVQHGCKDTPVCVHVSGTEADSLRLTVWNAGVIPETVLPFVFERFQRGSAEPTSRPQGLGLGLYIAQQIVLAHGGAIEARSSQAEGTSFCITLPRECTPAATTGAPAGAPRRPVVTDAVEE
ncbi:PAS domain S-box protein [Nannocystis pusilla]|uniref:PAS domain-containing sensor histidine kinase n=1 Tax=Nannocystis pusilla TaxID=889268 RepID=UPI003BF215AB